MYYKFEKLEVWQLTRIFVSEIYAVTKGFPKEEIFGLTSQIRRAAVSVLLNISEGCNRTQIEFCHFLNISLSSLEEVVAGLYISLDQNFISQKEFDSFYEKTNEIAAKIKSLINSIKNR
ncbi:MAG: four helix bundle protein [Patescibacteria group bacterium]